MAVKAGQILHVGNSFLIDRIQTAGPGNLNIPEEKVYELGNYLTVTTTRDTPDLSFDLESFDQSVEMEAILNGVDPGTVSDGDEFSFANCLPLDIISPFKDQGGVFTTVRGVIVPHLILESVQYRWALRQNATKNFTFRGDGIYYPMGTPFYEEFDAAATTGPFAFTNGPALPYVESGITRHVANARLVHADGSYTRLFVDVDYTTTVNNITLVEAGAAGDVLQVCYGSNDVATYNQAVHPDTTVKPGAVRHKDVFVYVGPQDGTLERWLGVQSMEVGWRINLDRDEELGNANAVSVDYDTADVSGTITMRPRDVEYLFDRIAQVTGTSNTGEMAGVYTSELLEVEIVVVDPLTGNTVQTVVVPDARFQPPPIQGRVQTKLETPFPFTSDGGELLVYSGDRPAS